MSLGTLERSEAFYHHCYLVAITLTIRHLTSSLFSAIK